MDFGYSNYHIHRDNQHAIVLVDDTTSLPALFGSIYLTQHLSVKAFGTQKNELSSVKFFYNYWFKKTGETLDHFFYRTNYNIALFIDDLNGFFDYLLSQQHLTDNEYIANVGFLGTAISQVTKVTYAEHIRAVRRFLKFLNERYMSLVYQDMSAAEADRVCRSNARKLKSKVREFKKICKSKSEPASHYKSISRMQHTQLNNMLLPSSPEILDENTGEFFEAHKNPLNPFTDCFLQYRNFLIHRLMYNYGIRVGEIQLITTQSYGESQPDSHGNIKYLLRVQNLPDGVDDPRKKPITLKTEASTRVIELDLDDYCYLTVFVDSYRAPLFSKEHPKYVRTDYGILFTTNRGKCQPLGYDAIRKFYQKIDKHFIALHPYYRSNNPLLNMVNLTPHVGRHTWAYITLEFIYNELLKDELKLGKQYGISSRMTGLLDAAANQLRPLGGWSDLSRMPYKYAKMFVERVANDSNLKRTSQDKKAVEIPTKSLPISTENNITSFLDDGEYDAFI